MAGDLERLTLTYWIMQKRIRALPMAPGARAMIVADVQVIFRAERAEIQPRPMVVRMMGRKPIRS